MTTSCLDRAHLQTRKGLQGPYHHTARFFAACVTLSCTETSKLFSLLIPILSPARVSGSE